jgi:medium-chain acyl-[acyl-carrier-protein] hydrolase
VPLKAWLRQVGSRRRSLARLICLPYAGAGPSAFQTWPALLPSWLGVWAAQMPGREARGREAPADDLRMVIDGVTAEIRTGLEPADGLPYALYGHSMGAVTAFELAHALPASGCPPPALLFVSGRRAPQIPDALPSIHRLPSPEFLREIRTLGGIPDEILAEPGLADLVVPNVAADFALIEGYSYEPRPKLSCGISVFGGDRDPTTARQQLEDWQVHAGGPFSLRVLPGDHFFINSQREVMLDEIAADLSAALGHATEDRADRYGAPVAGHSERPHG